LLLIEMAEHELEEPAQALRVDLHSTILQPRQPPRADSRCAHPNQRRASVVDAV